MAFDESKYKTAKFMKCKKCGNVFALGHSGNGAECPDCASDDLSHFRPDQHRDNETATNDS